MKSFRLVAAAVAVLLAAGGVCRPLPASAQAPEMGAAGMSAPDAYPHPVKVLRCDPQRTVSTSPTYVGFAPGYYGGPWRDPWGYNYYQPAVPTTVSETGTLYLDYRNATPKVMATIDFGLIANGRLVAEVRDVGTFSPNIEIKHSFGLSPNVFPLQTGLPQCVPLHIVFKDGTKWRNPHLPRHDKTVYHQ
jgi:hypothetical protein